MGLNGNDQTACLAAGYAQCAKGTLSLSTHSSAPNEKAKRHDKNDENLKDSKTKILQLL